MKLSLRTVLGSFSILRRRAAAVGQPGLGVWTDCGAKAAQQVATKVARQAHADEIADLEAKREIETTVAELRAGRPVATAIVHLKRADRLITKSAELAHDISEDVKL